MSKIPERSGNEIQKKKMTLANLEIGSEAIVTRLNGNNAITKRLMEMGVVPGVFVRVIKSAPFGDPLKFAYAVIIWRCGNPKPTR